jgi:Fe2+ or Zn2+ uptake regulation protein
MKKHYYLEDIITLCTRNHFSADEIFFQLKQKYPNITQGSVYRNLDKLVAEKKLNKIK